MKTTEIMLDNSNKSYESLLCLSLSSKSGHSASEREKSNLPVDPLLRKSILKTWIEELREDFGSEVSLVYLSTCHRIEFYSFGISPEALFSRWTELCGQSVLRAEVVRGIEAFEHLLKVNSSLASEVLGETQITGQVKQAFEESRQIGCLHGSLLRTFDEVLRISKRVRSETKIGTGTVSVAHVAIDGLIDVFEDLSDKRALVVGAGPVAEQSIQRLMKNGVGQLTWINRSSDRIYGHALSSACVIREFSELHRLAWEHSIIVLATSAEGPILRYEPILRSKSHAENICYGPKVVLDLGLPRNADEKLHGQHQFLIRNVDEFRDLAAQYTNHRRSAVKMAECIIKEESLNFIKLWNHWEQGELISNLYRSTKIMLDRELSKLKLDENSEIEYVVRNVYAKMMHQLLEQLRSLEESEAKRALVNLNLAWRQSETSWQKQTLNQHLPPNEALNPPVRPEKLTKLKAGPI